jgi:MoaA/NifB/PqqE/SkfB family radical SAM enzyme
MTEPSGAMCPAPFVVMDFAPEGYVHACCVNAAWPLGDVRRQTLRGIWDGERAQALRAAVARGDHGHGCGTCRHRLAHGTGYADVSYYREMPAPADPAWPEVMAFGLHNTCNLACVMCGGNLSSRLRTLEGRPRLEPAYGDRFFAELEDFLPHLRRAEFRGGEPFLIREHHRVWDLLLAMGLEPEIQVTTNGTLWDERVTRVLDAFPTQITFSLDGMTAETNTAIRVGSDHEAVLANARRFAAYAAERGTRFDLSFCLLRQNPHELAELVRFADELGGDAHAQVVLEREHGLHRLPTPELEATVADLERQGDELDVSEANRRMWAELVDWLRAELQQRQGGLPERIWERPGPANLDHVVERRQRAAGAHPRAADEAALARWATDGTVGELWTDADGRVTVADLAPIVPVRHEGPGDLVGSTIAEALAVVVARLGPHLWIIDETEAGDAVEQTLLLSPTALRDKTGLVLRLTSVADGTGGIRTLLAADTCFWPSPTPTPVAVAGS